MPKSTESYEAYSDKPKNVRREIISASGLLERKRFLLSSSPAIKERIKKLQEVVDEFQEKHPEFISLNLFGSLTKGYANPESDIDAHMYVDTDVKCTSEHVNVAYVQEVHADILRVRLRDTLSLSQEQIANVAIRTITKKEIKDLCVSDDFFYGEKQLFPLFLLALGRGIDNYRRIALDALESIGPRGESRWKDIINLLIDTENKGLDPKLIEKRKKLYPRTIADARKYFLHEEQGVH